MTAADHVCIEFGPGDFGIYPRDRCCAFFDLIGNMLADTGDSSNIVLRDTPRPAFEGLYLACDELVRTCKMPHTRIAGFASSAEFLLCPIFAVKKSKRVDALAAMIKYAPKFVQFCDIRGTTVTYDACLCAINANNSDLLETLWPLHASRDDNGLAINRAIARKSVDCLDYLLTVCSVNYESVSLVSLRSSFEIIKCLCSHGYPPEQLVEVAMNTDDPVAVQWIAEKCGGPTSGMLHMAITLGKTSVADMLAPHVAITPEIINKALIRGDLAFIRRITAGQSLSGVPITHAMRLDDEFLTFARDSGMNLTKLIYIAIKCDVPSALVFAGYKKINLIMICADRAKKCLKWAVDRGEVLTAKHVRAAGKDRAFLEFAVKYIGPVRGVNFEWFLYCTVEQLRGWHILGSYMSCCQLDHLIQQSVIFGRFDIIAYFAEDPANCKYGFLYAAVGAPIEIFQQIARVAMREPNDWPAMMPYDICRYVAENGGNIDKF